MKDFFSHLAFEGFAFGPIYIHTWGLAVALGFLLAIRLAGAKLKLLKKNGRIAELALFDEKIILNFSFNLIFAILIGSRLLFIVEEWPVFTKDFRAVFRIWEGGFSLFGGVIAALSYGYWWARKNKLSFWLLGEIFTPAWIFGLAIGRTGCFFIHDHLGKPTDLPWRMLIDGAYRHEPALYEAIFLIAIGFLLYFKQKKKRTKNIFLLSLLFYVFGRFWLDFFRAEEIAGGDSQWLNLTFAQWISLGTVMIAFLYYLKDKKCLLFLKNNSKVRR